jgi:hypothetical protein
MIACRLCFFLCVGIFFSLYGRTVEVGVWSEPGRVYALLVRDCPGRHVLISSLGSFKSMDWQTLPPFFPLVDSWKRVVLTFLSMVAYLLLLNLSGSHLSLFFYRFSSQNDLPSNMEANPDCSIRNRDYRPIDFHQFSGNPASPRVPWILGDPWICLVKLH